ncbi:MAG: hypothetical protein AB4040_06180 [Synechococcus sp.]
MDFIGGLLAGQLARRSGVPPLLGAFVAGLLLAWGEGISPDVMEWTRRIPCATGLTSCQNRVMSADCEG